MTTLSLFFKNVQLSPINQAVPLFDSCFQENCSFLVQIAELAIYTKKEMALNLSKI